MMIKKSTFDGFLNIFVNISSMSNTASTNLGLNYWNTWDILFPIIGFRLIPQKHMPFQNALYPYGSNICRCFWACAIITHTLSFVLPIFLPHFTSFFGKQSLGLMVRSYNLLWIHLKLHWHMLLFWHYLILPFFLKSKLLQAMLQ